MGVLSSWRRVAGYAGIVFAILFIVSIVIALGSPAWDDPVSEYRDWYTDSDTLVHFATFLGALAFVFFFLPFAAGVRKLLAACDEDSGHLWSRLSYTGAILAVAIGGAGSVFAEVLTLDIAEGASDDVVITLARLDALTYGAVLPWAIALFLGAASLVILHRGCLKPWIGWLGAVGAVVAVVGTVWTFSGDGENILGFVEFIGGYGIFVIWVLVVAWTLLKSTDAET